MALRVVGIDSICVLGTEQIYCNWLATNPSFSIPNSIPKPSQWQEMILSFKSVLMNPEVKTIRVATFWVIRTIGLMTAVDPQEARHLCEVFLRFFFNSLGIPVSDTIIRIDLKANTWTSKGAMIATRSILRSQVTTSRSWCILRNMGSVGRKLFFFGMMYFGWTVRDWAESHSSICLTVRTSFYS